jgi:Fe-S-cluster containining protein
MIKNNENKSFCSGCGQCCKRMPGIVHPRELAEVTVETLSKMIQDGYQFDHWEGNLTGEKEHEDIIFYYLRPQTKKSVGKVVDASWGGECIFLGEFGCNKSFEERPSQCRALNPTEDKSCYLDGEYSKTEIIKSWLPYNDLITSTIEKHYGY